MRLGKFSHLSVAALAAASLAIGCASSGGDDEVAPVSNTDFGANESAPTDDMIGEPGVRGLLETVYFDFDSAAIRSDMRPVLQGDVSKIGANASWKMVVIEGHCDERGSEEYNLALGERRANTVKQYLVDSGVSGGRIDTVSFGEAKAAVQGHDESAWKWNRRAEFVVNK
jgi:peptidoglycan-associated lipoprotein